MYSTLVVLHTLAGSVALATYWTAGFSRKGSPLHRRAGRVYLSAMAAILATGVPIIAVQYLRGRETFAVFLAYLLVVVLESCWTGLRAVHLKRNPAAYYGTAYRVAGALLLASGTAMLAYGMSNESALYAGFAFVGLIRGAVMLRASVRAPAPRWALSEHLGAMIGNGVATHVAFLLIGFARLLPTEWASQARMLAWFGPLGVAVLAGIWLTRRYVRPRVDARTAVS